jgi:hypothetical protein
MVQVLGVSGLEGELRLADPVLAGVQRRRQDVDVLVRQRPGDVGEQPVAVQGLTWMATRNELLAVGAQDTGTSRSDSARRLSALAQLVRCTETPEPLVTKPRISSPGTGCSTWPA